MKTDPENTMILSEARGESAPGSQADSMSRSKVRRSPADVLDLRGRCAALAETGGDGAVEAGAITDAFDWLFGNSNQDPLAGYGNAESDAEKAQGSARHPSLPAESIINFLARCGLVFIKGEPPATEDNVVLLWTGGCTAITAFRKDGEWLHCPSLQPLEEGEKIHCWMRMPHPSVWPEVKFPPNMFSEPDLYRMAESAIAHAAAQAAWTLQAGTHTANAVTDITILLGKMQSIVDETPAFSSVGPMAKKNLAELGDLIEAARKRLVDVQSVSDASPPPTSSTGEAR